MMTDWGAHHFDIAQWGLGMDESGPVEIMPPEDPKATKGLRYLYANGVEVLHGDSGGILFIGSEGKILVNRGKFEATPKSIGEEPLGANAIRLYNSYNHGKDFLDCMRSRKRPICDVEIGCRSVTVCHLGNLAYWNHRHLKWDPARKVGGRISRPESLQAMRHDDRSGAANRTATEGHYWASDPIHRRNDAQGFGHRATRGFNVSDDGFLSIFSRKDKQASDAATGELVGDPPPQRHTPFQKPAG